MAHATELLRRTHTALNSDLCAWSRPWTDWMRHPLAFVGAAGAAAAACGVFVNPQALIVLAALVVVGLLGVLWPWISICGLQVEASFLARRVAVGDAVLVRLSIVNRCPWPVWGLSLRRGFVPDGGADDGVALSRIGGWSRMDFDWTFRPARRGVYPLAPPQVDSGFPFGLLYARRPVRVNGTLIVWPQSVGLDAMPDAAELQAREDRLVDRHSGDLRDFVGTRPFRAGDSLRRVHWRQTARHGRLIVTERQASATCALRLVVDVSADAHDVAAGTLEKTLSIAASIVRSLHRQHALLECVVGDRVFAVGHSQGALWDCLDGLALVPADGVPFDGTCRLDRRLRDLTSIVITSDRAFTRHVQHPHAAASARYVIVNAAPPTDPDDRHAGCVCRSWIGLSVDERLDEVLSPRWRNACRVA